MKSASSSSAKSTASTTTKVPKGVVRRTTGIPYDDEITCVVCFEVADDPLMLPECNHVVCLKCAPGTLHGINVCDVKSNMDMMPSSVSPAASTTTTSSAAKWAVCNACGASGKVNGAEELTRNPLITKMCADRRSAIAGGHCVNCSVCQEETKMTPAEVFCGTCEVPFCQACWDNTHRGAMKKHNTTVLKENMNCFKPNMCTIHTNEPCKLFCSTDKENLCYVCATVTNSPHHGHTIVPIRDAVEEAKKTIGEAVTPLAEKKKSLVAQRARMNELINVLDTHQKETEAEVGKQVAALTELWTAFTTRLAEGGRVKSDMQRKALQVLSAQLDSTIEQIDTFANQGNIVLQGMDASKMFSLSALVGQLSANVTKFSRLDVMDIPNPQLFLKSPDNINITISKLLESCSVEMPPLPPLVVLMPFSSFGTVSGTDDLIISSDTTLTEENITKAYRNVVIKKGAVVTVSAWNGTTGGFARIQCFSFTLEEGGSIDVSNKGYRGAEVIKTNEQEGQASQGESDKGVGKKERTPNGSGGGGGNGSGRFGSTGGGGGGYATKGTNGDDNKYSGGTNPAGEGGLAVDLTVDLDKIPLGSGGGAGHPYTTGTAGPGGNGGGVVKITSHLAEIHGTILSNGGPGGEGQQYSSGGGGGSGGAVILKVGSRLVIGPTGVITANGGIGGLAHPTCGNISANGGAGSVGAVFIQIPRKEMYQGEGKITPAPTFPSNA